MLLVKLLIAKMLHMGTYDTAMGDISNEMASSKLIDSLG